MQDAERMLVPRMFGAGPDPGYEPELLNPFQSQEWRRADQRQLRFRNGNNVVERIANHPRGGEIGSRNDGRSRGHGHALTFLSRVNRSNAIALMFAILSFYPVCYKGQAQA